MLPAAPRARSAVPCPPADASGDVVVCARDPDSYRLKPLAPAPERQALPKAQLRLGSAALAAEAEQVQLNAGQQSQRLMLRLKLPIGRKKR